MKLTKQRLAESTRKELEEAIRRNPLDWLDDVVESIDEPAEELRAIIEGQYNRSGVGPLTIIGGLVEKFAVDVGQQAYDVIISHPGHV